MFSKYPEFVERSFQTIVNNIFCITQLYNFKQFVKISEHFVHIEGIGFVACCIPDNFYTNKSFSFRPYR